MAKRCFPFSSLSGGNNPSTSRDSDPRIMRDNLLRNLLNTAGEPEFSSLSISMSFERLLESSPRDSEQSALIDQSIKLGTLLVEAGKRSLRRRYSKHNSAAWPLSYDLTVKIFSLLNTQTLCSAAACCSIFRKCASDPLCYTNVNLTTTAPKVSNADVATIVRRAGKGLRSLKLGTIPTRSSFSTTRKENETCLLSRTCLIPLSSYSCLSGRLLKQLHLYNIQQMDAKSLNKALLACTSLLDLHLIGLKMKLSSLLGFVALRCPLIERLHMECSKTEKDETFRSLNCEAFLSNCPNISSLTLRGYELVDSRILTLVKGFKQLKYLDLSTSYNINGSFLRNIGGEELLECLILRDCLDLKDVEVLRMLFAAVKGEFRHLRHLDVSNKEGLASNGEWYDRKYEISGISIEEVMDARPELRVLAEFPFPYQRRYWW